LIDEKTEGSKSRDTVPLSKYLLNAVYGPVLIAAATTAATTREIRNIPPKTKLIIIILVKINAREIFRAKIATDRSPLLNSLRQPVLRIRIRKNPKLFGGSESEKKF
jgi:hypothetical protein